MTPIGDALAQQRHSRASSGSWPSALRLASGVFGIGQRVVDMDDPALERRPADQRAAAGRDRVARPVSLDIPVRTRTRPPRGICRRRSWWITALSASQIRAAVSTSVCNTGSSSKPDWLMTLSTSLVAVWYSSDSCRSSRALPQFVEQPGVLHRDHRLRRRSSCTSSICFLGERLDLAGEQATITPISDAVAQQRHARACVHAAEPSIVLGTRKRDRPAHRGFERPRPRKCARARHAFRGSGAIRTGAL